MLNPIEDAGDDDEVRKTFYQVQAEDDDNTFVDHGSTSISFCASGGGKTDKQEEVASPDSGLRRPFGSFELPAPIRMPQNASTVVVKPASADANNNNTEERVGTSFYFASSGYGVGTRTTPWNPPRLVSQMAMEQSVRAMTVNSDGKSLWLAIADDPLALLEVEGSDLVLSKTLDTVTRVHSMCMVTVPNTNHTRFKSMGDDNQVEVEEDSCFLWCGLTKGHISVVDIVQSTDGGYIRSAHSQTVHRLWNLPNGTVWSSGLDKAIKVWDPQTRRKLKNRNIAAVLQDLCYVSVTKEVWGIAEDCLIRVYEGSGDNAKLSKHGGENSIKMKNELVLIKYCEDANLVWAGMTKGAVLMDPNTYAIEANVNVTLSSIAFNKKTAVITGHGSLLDCTTDCVAVLDITNPLQPSPLFIGRPMEGVTPIGMHLFPNVPFAVVAQDEGRYKMKNLLMFTYEETMPLNKSLQAELPQRCVGGNFRGVPPLLNAVRQNSSPEGISPTAGEGAAGRDDHAPVRISRPAQGTHSAIPLNLLESIAQSTNETRHMLASLHREHAPISDFSKLLGSAGEWVLKAGPGALPPLEAHELIKIESTYTTTEGRQLATFFEQLQKAVSERDSSLDFGSTLKKLNTTNRYPNPSTDFNKTLNSTLNSDAVGVAQLLNQVTRTGASERAGFERQVRLLQRFNKRVTDSQNALLSAVTRVDQAVRTLTAEVLEELNEAIAASSEHSKESGKYHQLVSDVNVLTDLQSIQPISSNSAPTEINDAAINITNLLSKMVHIRTSMFATNPELSKGLLESSNHNSISDYRPPERGSSNGDGKGQPPLSQDEISLLIVESLLPPKRLMTRIDFELGKVRSFVQVSDEAWSLSQDLRRIDFSDQEFNYGQDFMQFPVLTDFREAKLMLDVCRLEGFLSITESILDRRPEDVYRIMNLFDSDCPEGTMLDFHGRVTTQLQVLVDVSIHLESFASLMRKSVTAARNSKSGDLFLYAVQYEGDKPLPIHIEKNRFDGMVYWGFVSCVLLCHCLECVESVVCPAREAVHIENDNFSVIMERLLEWERFLREMERRATHLHFILTASTFAGQRIAHMKEKCDLKNLSSTTSKSRHSALSIEEGAGFDTAVSTGENDLSLHHLLLFLYMRVALKDENEAQRDLFKQIMEVKATNVVCLIQQAGSLLQYNAFLQHRSRILSEAGFAENSNCYVASPLTSNEDTLDAKVKAACRGCYM